MAAVLNRIGFRLRKVVKALVPFNVEQHVFWI
jgi:hypothetical protein